MPALARGQASDCSNPELDLFTTVSGVPTDVSSLSFQIFEKVTNPLVPAQIFPVTPGDKEDVDVAQACPTGDKIATGRYVAKWTPAVDELLGTHEIRWFFKLTPSSPEQTFREEFEILAEVVGGGGQGYCTIAEIRDEGVTEAMAGDAKLQRLIDSCSRKIDYYTGQYFNARLLTRVPHNGTGARFIRFGIPICEITELFIGEVEEGGSLEVDEDFLVYNRHLRYNLLNPDDRKDPRIEYKTALSKFTEGRHNIIVSGYFGYTDYDGQEPLRGVTPPLISQACVMMVIRELPDKSRLEDRIQSEQPWRLTSIKTRDQSLNWASPKDFGRPAGGVFTGDPEIDKILVQYRRSFGIHKV
jgi:hypothetical protein